MITINGFDKEFVLDLNKESYYEHVFNIESKGGNGNKLPWGVEMVSHGLISAVPGANDTLNISVNIDELAEDGFVLLRNYNKERIKIIILHNTVLTLPKTYKFRVTKKSTDGRKVRIRILSKENNAEIGWECTYDGKPLNYSIVPMSSDKSGYVDIEVLDELFVDVKSVIEFTQDKSGEVIRLTLNQNNKETEIIKAD